MALPSCPRCKWRRIVACPRFATNMVSTIATECLKFFKLFRGPSTGKLSLTLWLVMESGCSLQAPCLPESDFRAKEAVTVITDPQHKPWPLPRFAQRGGQQKTAEPSECGPYDPYQIQPSPVSLLTFCPHRRYSECPERESQASSCRYMPGRVCLGAGALFLNQEINT